MTAECRIVKRKKCRKCSRTFLTRRGLKQHREWHKRSDAIRRAGGKGLVASRGQRVLQRTPDGVATTPYEPSRYSGRAVSLQTLDQMLKESTSQKLLKKALRDELEKNPVKFFKEIIMPNMPKAAILRLEQTDQPIQPPVVITFAPQSDLEASIPTPIPIPTTVDLSQPGAEENLAIANDDPYHEIIDAEFSSQNRETPLEEAQLQEEPSRESA